MGRAYAAYAKEVDALHAAEKRAAEAAASQDPAVRKATDEAIARASSVRASLVADARSVRDGVRGEFRNMSVFGQKYEFIKPADSDAAEWVGQYTSRSLDGFIRELAAEAINHSKAYGSLSSSETTTGKLWAATFDSGCVLLPFALALSSFTVIWDLLMLPSRFAMRKRMDFAVNEGNRIYWQTDLAARIAEHPALPFEELGGGTPITAEQYVQFERDRAFSRATGDTAGARSGVEECRRKLADAEAALKKAVAALNASSAPALGAWGTVPSNAAAMDVDPGILRLGRISDPAPQSLDVPWAVDLHARPSVVFLCQDGGARRHTEAVLGSAAIRAMSAFPPGYAKFTFVDLSSAGAPFAAAVSGLAGTQLVSGGKTFVQQRDVEQALSKALEDVGQRLQTLGHQYEDIDDLNRRSPGRKLPRHFIMINGFPSGMTSDQARVVSTIMAQGGKCGVHVLVSVDPGTDMSRYMSNLNELPAAIVSVNSTDAGVRGMEGRICLDTPPAATLASVFVNNANEGGKTAGKVAIPYNALERERNASSADGIRVPVGMDQGGAQKYLQFGDANPHALIQGRSGTGKSTLLHTMICGLAEQYSPDELELYLLDMKAVEFSAYGPRAGAAGLPHAKVISANSDSEFGVAVLRGVAAMLEERKMEFSRVGVQSLGDYRRKSGKPMPRVLIVLDEFQNLFLQDLGEAGESKMLLENVARQGRSFGVHMILATQLYKASDVTRGTLEQATLRISLRCGEQDAVAMLGNEAAKFVEELGAQGEGVVQDAGQHQVRNDIVKFALLSPTDRERIIANLAAKFPPRPGFVFFEGDKPALPWEQRYFADATRTRPTTPPRRIDLWLGRPVGVDTSIAFPLRRDPGRNLALFGPDADIAVGSMLSCVASAAAQARPGTLEFIFLNALRSDDDWGDVVRRLPSLLSHKAENVARAHIVERLERLVEEIEPRDPDDSTSPTILVFGFGMFNASELSTSDKCFMSLLEKGADRGVHFIGWWRTKNDVTKHVDTKRMDRLGGRLYFHLSSDDAGSLLPSGRLVTAVTRMERNRSALLDMEEPDRVTKIVPFSAQERDMTRWTDWLGTLR